MKALALALLAALGGCAAAEQPSAHVVYVDGYSYVDHGVYDGPPPPETIIPQDDPEVGEMTAPLPTAMTTGALLDPAANPVAAPR